MNADRRRIDTSRIDRELRDRLPQYIARRHKIVPLFGSDNHLVVAATDGQADPERMREIGEQIGMSIVAYDFEQYSGEEISEAIEGLYRGQHMRLGELLILDGVLTEKQLDTALEKQAESPEKKIGDILGELGYADEGKLQEAYASQIGCRFLSINAALFLDLSVVNMLPRELMTERGVLPVPKSTSADEVYLLVCERASEELIEEVRGYLGARVIEPVLTSRTELDEVIEDCLRRLGYVEVRDKLLGQYLIDRRLLSREQLEAAVREQKQRGLKLGELLVANGIVSERVMLEVIAQQLGVDYMLTLPEIIPDDFKDLITKTFAVSNQVMPIALEGDALLVAMADPQEKKLVSLLRQMFSREVKPVLAAGKNILQAIERYYSCTNGLESGVAAGRAPAEVLDEDGRREAERVAGLVGGILSDGVKRDASDIHIAPREGAIDLFYRLDGELVRVAELPGGDCSDIAARIKSMAGMRDDEPKVPQSGRISERIAGRRVDFRVSTLPTSFGENIVMRVLDCGRLLESDLGRLGVPPEVKGPLLEWCERPQGLILISGPTGSGKTTTLYNVLNWLHAKNPQKNISTVEDSIGCDIEGVVQSEVGRDDGSGAVSAMNEQLRQNPDLIIVDEIRGAEEGSLALATALGGRMVIGTIHSCDGVLALRRLVDMGLEPRDISVVVSCILSQRLAKRICQRCAEEHLPDEEEIARVRMTIPGFEPRRHNLKTGSGCNACDDGFRGYVGIYELLLLNTVIKQLIGRGAGEEEIRDAAIRNGMKTLRMAGYDLALRGVTTLSEVTRVARGDDSED